MKKLYNFFSEYNFTNFFYSYALVFLIPFIVLAMAIWQIAHNNLKNQINKTIEFNLYQLKNTMDANLDNLQDIAHQISLDSNTSKYFLEHPYYAKTSYQSLKTYTSMNPLIDDIAIYYPKSDNKIHTSNGSYHFDVFVKSNLDQLTKETFQNYLSVATPSIEYLANEGKNSETRLSFFVPINTQFKNSSSIIIFFLKKKNLENTIVNQLNKPEHYILINSLQRNLSYNQILKKNNLIHYKKNIKNIHSIQKEYTLKHLSSDKYPLQFYYLEKNSTLMAPIQKLNFSLIICFISLLGFGLFICIIISYVKEKPMQKLNTLFHDIAKKEETHSNIPIDEKLSYFMKMHKDLNTTLKQQQLFLSTNIWSIILQGYNLETLDITDELDKLELTTDFNCFFVGNVNSNFLENESDNIKAKTVFVNSFPLEFKNHKIFCIEIPRKQELTLIFCSKYFENSLELFLSQFELFIKSKTSLSIDILYGQPYNHLQNISISYSETIKLKQTNLYSNNIKDRIYHDYEPNSCNTTNLDFKEHLIDKLILDLENGNLNSCHITLEKLFDKKLDDLTSVSVPFYYYHIFNQILNCANKHKIDIDVQLLNSIHQEKSIEKLLIIANSLISQICIFLQNKYEIEQNKLDSVIINYLNDNFSYYEISLESMALHFNLSVSYLSKMIKLETGTTFSKYIQQLRLEKIQHDLIFLDDSIKNIIQSAGYIDVSNYTRKFKKITGMTPGQYRAFHKHLKEPTQI